MKPTTKPANPLFSSGPTTKRPGWSLEALDDALLGRSHRSKPGKAKLKQVIDLTRDVLEVPADYRIGIVPASDTGAVEMAMWSMLGQRGVDIFAWESFSKDWAKDAKLLDLKDLRIFDADYGQLPDLSQAQADRDIVFAWNGTTSGVKVPDANWIADEREGITICDATSAAFAMPLPWSKLDVTTFSWQKAMGGEAAHGIIILSPRAVERLENYTPPRALPKIFRMTAKGKINEGLFEGATINTPSMLAVEDAIDSLQWMKQEGGLKAMIARSEANLAAIERWVEQTPWIAFLPETKETRSSTSICLKIVDPWYTSLSAEQQAAKAKEMTKLLDSEGAAYDIDAYRDAPAGIRIWGGSTVETRDIEALLPWLDWAFTQVKDQAIAA